MYVVAAGTLWEFHLFQQSNVYDSSTPLACQILRAWIKIPPSAPSQNIQITKGNIQMIILILMIIVRMRIIVKIFTIMK